MPARSAFERALEHALGASLIDSPAAESSVAAVYRTTLGSVFVKRTAAAEFERFAAEAAGLDELRRVSAWRVPRVLAVARTSSSAFIALEYVEFGRATAASERALGAALAQLHRCGAPQYGWHRDNTIGRTPQTNTWHDDWVAFYREQRLLPQIRRAQAAGATNRLIDRSLQLVDYLPQFFTDYRPQPALLHGDLWGGNWAVDRDGQPVIFDPAVYFGDREADLAMTRLFGGFSGAFYAAYMDAWPLDSGASQRVALYSLYHVLNHYNLFGGSYHQQALQLVDQLLSAVEL